MLSNKTYDIIYADPPWNGLGWNNGSGKKCPAKHYSVMHDNWIKSLNVQSIANTPSVLLLWVTFPNLPLGIEVVKSWGFNYATVAFTWVKKNKRSDTYFMGCGNYTRANAEICLLGTKPGCQKWVQTKTVRQICDARIMEHSKKPPEIRERIVQLFGDRPRIELFAREKTNGWDAWGNEV